MLRNPIDKRKGRRRYILSRGTTSEIDLNSTAALTEFIAKIGGDPYNNDAVMNVADFEGIYKECPVDVAAFQGARKVTNLCKWSQDISNAAWAKLGAPSIVGTDKITATGQGDGIQQTITGEGAWKAVISFIAHVSTPLGQLTGYQVRSYGSTSGSGTNLPTLSYTPVRYSMELTNNPAIGGNTISIGFRDYNTSSWAQVTITDFQVENVTGQTNQNPSDHIPTTTAAVTEYYDTENGNTVSSNVVTEAAGAALTNTIGMAFWESETNNFASGEYRTFSAWDSVSCNVTKDQIGVDGTPNSASTLEDDNASGAEYCLNYFTGLVDDTSWVSCSFLIKKDTNTTRYPSFLVALSGGVTAKNEQIILNTQTGAVNEIAWNADGEYNVFSIGYWWFVTLALQNNATGNTTATAQVWAAASTNGTSFAGSATGSIIADWAQFCNARRCPVHLIAGGVTSDTPDLHFPNDKLIANKQGYVYAEAQLMPDDMVISPRGAIIHNGNRVLHGYAPHDLRSNDSTTNTSLSNGLTGYSKSVVHWADVLKQVTSNGSSSSEGSYDGAWGSGSIYVGSENGSVRAFNGIISKIIFGYNIKTTQAEMEELTTPG